MKYEYPKELQKILTFFKKLPGVGSKTAERFAFEILSWGKEELTFFSETIQKAKEQIQNCEECGALKETSCPFCSSSSRNKEILCVVSSAKEIFLIENTRSYQGLYHVLENLLSPLEGKEEKDVGIESLQKRIEARNIQEILLALDSTLEGDATSLFLKESLKNYSLRFSRLALGIPLGSSLDYVDNATLGRALTNRQML